MKILFLGELDIHEKAFLPYLNKYHKIVVVNTSLWDYPNKIPKTDIPVYNLYKNSKIRHLFKGKFEFLIKSGIYSILEKQKYLWSDISQLIKNEDIDIIYGAWGSMCLFEFKLVKKFNIPLVYEFLTYPINTNIFTVKFENLINKKIIADLSGRVLSSRNMFRYMRKNFDISKGKNMIFRECYPANFYYKQRLPSLSEQDNKPHIIFLGSTVTDVFPQIEKLSSHGICVHIMESKDNKGEFTSKHKNIFSFKSYSYEDLFNGSLSTFMTQFDACLVTYNFNIAQVKHRYINCIPNRFSFALTAGIPIVLPNGYLLGCEEIINQYKNGFTYNNYLDLKNKLKNECLMNYYKTNALSNHHQFSLENNFEKYNNFLKLIE